MGENKSLLSQIVTWTILGILAIVALKIALRLLGVVFGVVGFVVFTVGPLLLIGWLAVKLWKAFTREPVA